MEVALGMLQALGIFLGVPAVLGFAIAGLLAWRAAVQEPEASPRGGELRLRDADVFRGLSDDQLNRVVALAQFTRVVAGEALGRAGELGDRLFIIVEGEAQLSAPSLLGDITVRVAGRGESFPLAALVGAGSLITSGKALSDMELCVIPRSRLMALCSQEPAIGLKVYRNIANLFADRYSKMLRRFAFSATKVAENADFLANI